MTRDERCPGRLLDRGNSNRRMVYAIPECAVGDDFPLSDKALQQPTDSKNAARTEEERPTDEQQKQIAGTQYNRNSSRPVSSCPVLSRPRTVPPSLI